MRVAILISGTGSNMLALVHAMQAGKWATPAIVISDQAEARGIQSADQLGIPTKIITRKTDRADHEREIIRELQDAQVDLICLAGYMRVLSADFIAQYPGQILNIHPSLLPKYKGLNTHQRAIDAGDKIAGCSVHIVTAALDDGPILGQRRVAIATDDTAGTVAAKVQKQEHQLYPAVLADFIAQSHRVS